MEKIIDLHIHTNVSDGDLSPKEVIDFAFDNGVSVVSIADHDTVDAYDSDLLLYAKDKGVTLIPGVEISCKWEKCGVHVLGYNFNLNDNFFRSELLKICNARHDYLFSVSERLMDLGYIINVSKLDEIDSVTKAHIASDVINNDKNRELLIKNYGHIPNKGEFIETVMNEGCPAYVKKNSISPRDAADLIRRAGGTVVLAHPVAYKYEDGLTENDILNIIRDMNINAIESNYIYIDRNNIKHDDSQYWNNFAKNNNFIGTIGSDFHGYDGIRPVIGFIGEDIDFCVLQSNKILDFILN